MMATKPITLFQRDLLGAALDLSEGKLWLPRDAADSLPTTLAAIKELEKRKLVERMPHATGDILRWTVTDAGREARREAAPPPAPAPMTILASAPAPAPLKTVMPTPAPAPAPAKTL